MFFPGTSWGHGSWENKFGIEICDRKIFGIPGLLFGMLNLSYIIYRLITS